MSIPDSGDWDIASNYTIDMWVQFNTVDTNQALWGHKEGTTEYIGGFWEQSTSRLIWYDYRNGGPWPLMYGENWLPSTGTWYHIAYVKNGTDLKMYIDGEILGSGAAYSGSPRSSAANLTIGQYSNSYFNGYMDDVRFTKNEALWTSNFIPPTEPATATVNTVLLLNMEGAEGSNSFTDLSSSNHIVTSNGEVKITGMEDAFEDALYFD